MKSNLLITITFFLTFNFLGAQTTWNYAGAAGSFGAENSKAICTDASGNIYMTGSFTNTVDFDFGAGVTNLTSSSGSYSDIFIASYTSVGALRWAIKAGSASRPDNVSNGAITTDGTNVYVAGNFGGQGAVFGTTTLNSNGGENTTDIFVAKLNASTGAYSWVHNYGGNSGDNCVAMCLDASNNIYITGNYSLTFSSCTNPSNVGGAGTTDIYVSKLSPSDGSCQWITSAGGALGDGGTGSGLTYATISDKIVLTTEYSSSTATFGGFTLTNTGSGNDIAVCELNPSSGAFTSAITFGTAGNDDASSCAYDAVTGDVFVTGNYDSNPITIPNGSTGISLSNSGGADIWVGRYSMTTHNFGWAKKAGGTSGDIGQEKAYGICSGGDGTIAITGAFLSSTCDFGSFTLNNSTGFGKIFVASYQASDGAEIWVNEGTTTNSPALQSTGKSITTIANSANYWITGNFSATTTFGAQTSLVSSGYNNLFNSKLNAPLPCATVSVSAVSQTNASCYGGSNGAASVSASGGSGFTYNWTPGNPTGDGTASTTGLTAGTWTCTVTNSCGNTGFRTFAITQPAAYVLPSITGVDTICINATATLSNDTANGTWSSDATSVITVNSTTGELSGVTAGTATITYSITNSCGTFSKTKLIRVLAAPDAPAAIIGLGSVCVGATITLSDVDAHGVWSSDNTSSASVNASTGDVTGVSVGNATISYTLNNACGSNSAIYGVAVIDAPILGPVTGASSVCKGGATTLTNSVGGGSWSSDATSVATVNSSTGVVSGRDSGLAVITYSLTNACATATNSMQITVNPTVPVSVSISASPSSTICVGTSVTFTATPTNGGTNPLYQWYKNGVYISGAHFPTYTSASLTNGTVITCTLISNEVCATVTPVTSDGITMTVNSYLTTSVSVGASATKICAGTSVTFTATPINGGTSPTYQWKKNSLDIQGETNSTYTSTLLNNNDSIKCVMISNVACPSVNPSTSAVKIMTVNQNLPASVSIMASPSSTICVGTSVTFTATPTNGGTNPLYQWYKNGVYISGAHFPTYTSSSLTNGVVITCIMTSNAVCATSNPVTSDGITMTVNSYLTTSVSIGASATIICSGTSVTFTATPINGGTSPTYQWKKNSLDIQGETNSTYTSASLNNNDSIKCVMISNAVCPSLNPSTSAVKIMTVNQNLPASVSVLASPSSTICVGTSVTFTATPTNGGTNPLYQWYKNGVYISGAHFPTYTSSSLTNGVVITCIMTSNAVCATSNPVTSDGITMTVNAYLTTSVSIVASATIICSGTSVAFTASPTNGGTLPTYQWKKNSLDIQGETNSTYTSASLNNNDSIKCVMISNAACPSVNPSTSAVKIMTVNQNLPASVSVLASPSSTVTGGTSVTFTASPTNGGTNPVYQWYKNGVYISGAHFPTYTSSSLTSGTVITCTMTSNAVCAAGNPATSAGITMTILSSLTTASCNSTLTNMSDYIYANAVSGATNYRFLVENAGLGFSVSYVTTSAYMKLSNIAGLIYNTAYTVKVAVFVNGTWSPYGDVCTINTPVNVTSTSLTTAFCNTTIPDMYTYIYCNQVYGAISYKYKIENSTLGFSVDYVSPNTYAFRPANISGLLYNTTYTVKVATLIQGTWSDYGAVCSFTTPAISLTSLTTTYCNSTLIDMTTNIYATSLYGATAYKYLFENTNLGFSTTYSTTTSYARLNNVSGLLYNTTYTVKVAALINGDWTSYGSQCTITTPATVPTTSLTDAFCNTTIPDMYTYIYCKQVYGATSYKYRIENTALGFLVDYISPNTYAFRPSNVIGLINNTAYTVKVATLVQGTWTDYGSVCTFSTPITRMAEIVDNSNNINNSKPFYVIAYPNPSNESVTIEHNFFGEVNLKLMDLTGRVVSEIKTSDAQIILGRDLAAGIYHLSIFNGKESKVVKIVKQ